METGTATEETQSLMLDGNAMAGLLQEQLLWARWRDGQPVGFYGKPGLRLALPGLPECGAEDGGYRGPGLPGCQGSSIFTYP
jgi:hypothetical protein